MNRRQFLASACGAAIAGIPVIAAAQTSPNAAQIQRQLEAAPQRPLPEDERVSPRVFKRDPRLRRRAPSIDIRSINFEFGSARIPASQRWKVEQIGIAMRRILRRNPRELFLIEGHTDAVGSYASNQVLSERRAASVARDLTRYFGVPRRALETIGYGEEELLVPTPNAEWRNRRVTLRRITDFVTLY